MRKFLNVAIALMLLFAPLVQTNQIGEIPSRLVSFGTEIDDGCDNETREDDEFYFVDGNLGNDSNLGTEACPFATISKAAESITNGDTVIISNSIYRESVTIDGIEGATFKAADGEKVVIDGSRDIEDDLGGQWQEYQDGIFQTVVSQDVWQLFLDLEEMIPARWPNANFTDGSVFNKSISWAQGSMDRDKYKDGDGNWVYPYGNGELKDITGLNESGIDPTGAIAILNVGSFRTWSRNITDFDSENNTFKFDEVSSWKTKHHYYFLEGKLELIDSPGEWFFDNENNKVYFFPPDGVNPSDANIRMKTQPYGFSSDNSNDIVLENIDFFANTFHFNDCENCRVDGSHLIYPSTSKRSLNIAGEDVDERWVSRFDKSSNCVVDNSAFLYTDGTAIEFHGGDLQSHNNTINNSYFYHIDWSVSDTPGLMVTVIDSGRDNTFSNNTIHLTGASATLSIGDAPTVFHNEVWNTGLLQSDGAVVQMMMAEQKNAHIAYNWIHNTNKYGIRMDGPMGGTNEGRNATVHHNVLWNVSGALMVKGDYHTTHSNTVFGTDNSKNNIIILYEAGFGNENSTTAFNAADRIAAHRSGNYEDYPVPGNYSSNFNGYVDSITRSHDIEITSGMDFSPNEITISVGDSVTWTNNDSMSHTVTSVNDYFDSGNIASEGSWSFAFTEVGTYDYVCEYHSSMTGTVIVIDNRGSIESQLVDPYNYDFRPREDSIINEIGAGAYSIEDNWVAGISWYFSGPELPFEGCMDIDAINYDERNLFSDGSCIYPPVEGCMDPEAKNYNPDAEVDDGSCEYYIEGCMDPDAKNYDSEAEIDDGSCEYYVEGCTDKDAKNWNPDAEIDDGSCEYYVEGCTDSNATNYNSTAEVDDGSCEYPEEPDPVEGCMDVNATNFNSEAEIDDGSCEYPEEPDPVEGCMDVNATNYNSEAEINDGSCEYPEVLDCIFGLIEYTNDTSVIFYLSWIDNSGIKQCGTLEIELYDGAVPIHSKNFRDHVSAGNYDGVNFHRIIEDFMIQGGDFQYGDGTGGYAYSWHGYCNGYSVSKEECPSTELYTLPDEIVIGYNHIPGALSMAKTAMPNTGGSQFFIVDAGVNANWLDGIHTVFGQAVAGTINGQAATGISVVNAMSQVEVASSGSSPVHNVTIVSAKIVSEPSVGCTNSTATNYSSLAEIDDGSCEFEPEKLNYCPDEITEENENLVEESCLATFDEPDESGKDDDEGFLPSLSFFVSICAIAIIAFRRR